MEGGEMVDLAQHFYAQLKAHPDKALITEVQGQQLVPSHGRELAARIAAGRGSLRARGVGAGQRVVLLAPNSSAWLAADLALMFEGAISVPMYARQAPHELVGMMKDCDASLVLCADETLASGIIAHWPNAPIMLFEAFFGGEALDAPPVSVQPDTPVTIIYTSGTSGEPKGVVLTAANMAFMLPVIASAIDELMGSQSEEHRVFHYLPFCFAGSRMVLWMCLYRANGLMVSTDLNNLAQEFKTAKPNYFLNVPALLERIKNGVEAKIRKKSSVIQALYDQGVAAYQAIVDGDATTWQRAVFGVSTRLVFKAIKQQIGPQLRCLICGSAPLGPDTQRWFEMLGIPVYQVYGLTETTAIVTMDKPGRVAPGRVGFVLDGCETRITEEGELQVKGPNMFAGYWGRDEATEAAFDDGWFRTGDRCERDDEGNVRVIGRVRNLLVPSSGHNIAPEPIEQRLVETTEGLEQAVLIGHGRPFLTAIVAGDVSRSHLQAAIERVNAELPHYRRIRDVHLSDTLFTPENGLLTANQKLRRSAIERHFQAAIEAMYVN